MGFKKNFIRFWLVPPSGSGFLKVLRMNEHRLGLLLQIQQLTPPNMSGPLVTDKLLMKYHQSSSLRR